MCGLNVIFGFAEGSEAIGLMNQALHHRGPDEGDVYTSPSRDVWLGSRRLKIIDVDHGKMPYRSKCGRYAMVFNGEIYEHESLRDRCSSYDFSSKSDGEVLFALLQQHGASALSWINGMFSFCFWDEQKAELLVARDRLGIKPLFYVLKENGLLISSEIRGLLAHPHFAELSPDALDHEATQDYFSLLSVSEPKSIYREIKRFPAGSYATLKADPSFAPHHFVPKPFWKLSFQKSKLPKNSMAERLESTLGKAIERRLVSDVPLGMFLSAGIDSSVILSMATQSLGRGLECHGMKFEGGDDETLLAEKTAKLHGCQFVAHEVKEAEFLENLPQVVEAFAEPFAGGVPLWFLCKNVQHDLTVALTGTGGDECFGQYGRVQHLQPQLGPWSALKYLMKHPDQLYRHPLDLLQVLRQGAPIGHFYHEKVCTLKSLEKKNLLRVGSAFEVEHRVDHLFREHRDLDLSDQLMAVSLKTQLKDEFLHSQDILSMDHSMELRVPFLDHTFVECCASLPSQWRSTGADPKGQMKEIFKAHIPEHILNRPKSGFMMPYGRWLKGELKPQAELLFSRDWIEEQGLFHFAAVDKLWQAHLAGQNRDYPLWSLYIFQLWWKRFL